MTRKRLATAAAVSVVALAAAALHSSARGRARPAPGGAEDSASAPTFYRDVLPILQDHCQRCHRTSGIAPMPLETYREVHRWARAIADQARTRRMPPWFADPRFGHFANDPSLTPQQIETLAWWAGAGAPAGDPHDSPPPRRWSGGWNIPQPDRVIAMPKPLKIPAHGDVEYTYEIVPTEFTRDTWVRMSQVLPSSPEHVHHAVVYIRPPDSKWLRHAPVGVPFTASSLRDPGDRADAEWTDSDILLVYAPGSSPDQWPGSMGKLVPAGSDLVFQMHYTTNGHAASDRSSIGLVFNDHVPAQRVLTLQLTNDRFVIPPGVDNFRVEVHGTLPNDCTLLSFLPHMHLRGKRFEYNIVHAGGRIETLLRVNYDFYWQLSYRLAEPRKLQAGTELEAVAWYDNSTANPHNPDPTAAVHWGDQTYDEMMVGFFEVAVPAGMGKQQFFVRRSSRLRH
ncbi:MAG TPA: thiol-disulfide isomerase [Terriglobia bacterium]|nr:thiol-disulfide isomerase [Terriglobia bacterium]